MRFALALTGIAFLFNFASSVEAQQGLESFVTESGKCTQAELDDLGQSQSGFTYSIQPTEILSVFGRNPLPTDQVIPRITSLRCHYSDRDLVLISSAKGEGNYCGWVRKENLIQFSSDAGVAGADPLSQALGLDEDCPQVTPLSIKRYCLIMSGLDLPIAECENPLVKESPFETKFIVFNAYQNTGADSVSRVTIPVYETYTGEDAAQQRAEAKIFNVLRVYNAKKGDDGIVRYLVGANYNNMLGWMSAEAGTIWYSKLATFFAASGVESVMSDVPHVADAEALGVVPANISAMVSGPREYRRYPVLIDNREDVASGNPSNNPYLDIAFIGSFCEGETRLLCAGEDDVGSAAPLELLNRADILFLIDGTKSMEPYFKLVSDAVTTASADFLGNVNIQFGAAIYGDFVRPSARGLDDEMQFSTVIELDSIIDGDEFEDLPQTTLFIRDPLRDKPEAAHAALYRAVNTTGWRGDSPKYVIHIADHGDRVRPPQALLDALISEKIIYLPVAVRGEAVSPASDRFVEDAREIFERHLSPNGEPLAVAPLVTYTRGTVNRANEYSAILSAVRSSMELGNKARDITLDELYGRTSPGDTATSRYVPGYAALTRAAMDLYLGETAISAADVEKRTIAARGYVKTARVGDLETNWDYFAEIRASDLDLLERNFETLCYKILDSDAREANANAIWVLIETLTGDKLRDMDDFAAYLNDRDKIPLAKQTILGPGLLQLATALSDTSPEAKARLGKFQRSVCRTAKLMELVQGRVKLDNPFEQRNGVEGDLIWRDVAYTHRNGYPHSWIFTDDFQETSIFLPLSYLPEEISME